MEVLFVVVGISVLILIHEFGHFLAARKFGLLVEEFGFGFPPKLFSKKIGETIYSLNALPFGGFVRLHGENQWNTVNETEKKRSFIFQPAWKRILVIVAGVFMNFFLGWMLMSAVFMIGTPKMVLVSEVLKGSPAELAGLMAKDQLRDFSTAQSFIDLIKDNRGKEVSLNITRGGEVSVIKVIPRLTGEAALGVVVIDTGIDRAGFFPALWEGLKAAGSITISILAGFWALIWGLITQGRVAVDLVGPIGIFGIANEAGSLGLVYLVQLIALISLNLAVLNIFPFPALDGGRLLFVIVEKIKGSRLSENFERNANGIGFLLLLLLIIAVTARDVIRLF